MHFPDNLPELGLALNSYLAQHASELPDDVREKLLEISANPAMPPAFAQAGELLYARRADVDDEAKLLAAQLIGFGTMHSQFGFGEDRRGARMIAALRRELGQENPLGEPWQDPEEDPAPKPEYLPPVDPEDLPEMPGPPPIEPPPPAEEEEA